METPRVASEDLSEDLPAAGRGWSFGLIAVAVLRLIDAGGQVLNAFGIGSLGEQLPVIVTPGITVALQLGWAALSIAGVIGILARTRWGWVLTMVLVGGGLAYDLYQYLSGAPDPVDLAVHVATAFYLNQRSVRAMAEDAEALDRTQAVR